MKDYGVAIRTISLSFFLSFFFCLTSAQLFNIFCELLCLRPNVSHLPNKMFLYKNQNGVASGADPSVRTHQKRGKEMKSPHKLWLKCLPAFTGTGCKNNHVQEHMWGVFFSNTSLCPFRDFMFFSRINQAELSGPLTAQIRVCSGKSGVLRHALLRCWSIILRPPMMSAATLLSIILSY